MGEWGRKDYLRFFRKKREGGDSFTELLTEKAGNSPFLKGRKSPKKGVLSGRKNWWEI